jgi:hypothetical protein
MVPASTSASKAAGTPHALRKLLYLDDFGGEDALQDELGDTVALLDLEVGLGVVEEEHLDLASVISVNDAGASVNEVLGREARTWRNAAVCRSYIISNRFVSSLDSAQVGEVGG